MNAALLSILVSSQCTIVSVCVWAGAWCVRYNTMVVIAAKAERRRYIGNFYVSLGTICMMRPAGHDRELHRTHFNDYVS